MKISSTIMKLDNHLKRKSTDYTEKHFHEKLLFLIYTDNPFLLHLNCKM